ncbi:cache domain-containing protein [Halomonas sp. LY9]
MNRFSPLPARHRFSLAWRVTALSSLLLLILVALFIWLGHHHLMQQFENSRMAHHERQQREIRLAMQRSADNLRQLAGLTAAAPALGNALAINDTLAIDNALRSQWPSLQLEAGVDEVLVFNPQGQQLGHSGGMQPVSELPVQGWIDDVLAREAPMTTLRCGLNCQQYAAVPILMAGSSIGMVVLSRSLADVTREAKEVSGSEIALMVTGYTGTATLDVGRRLPEWNGHLVALTSREATLPLLERASHVAPIFTLADRPLSLPYAERYLEISAVYMEDDADWRSTGYFLLISDVTPQTVAIQKATNTLLVLGVVGWLAAELLLLAILLGPMARLRRVASLLPALAKGDFTGVRGKLPQHTPRLSNEIDVLENVTRTLANQLEHLESSVTVHSSQLAERIDELARERDFVNSLLDTAQVFIVVHSSDGRIQRVNAYTRGRLALNDSELIGRYFYDIFDQLPPQGCRYQAGHWPEILR